MRLDGRVGLGDVRVDAGRRERRRVDRHLGRGQARVIGPLEAEVGLEVLTRQVHRRALVGAVVAEVGDRGAVAGGRGPRLEVLRVALDVAGQQRRAGHLAVLADERAVGLARKGHLGDPGHDQRVDEPEQHREDDDHQRAADEVLAHVLEELGREGLDDRAQQEGRQERQGADQHHDADQQEAERRRVGAHRPQPDRRDLLLGQRAGDGEHREDRDEAAEEHREAAHDVGERDAMGPDVAGRVGLQVAGVAGERRAVVVGLREVGVERLAEALRAGGVDRRAAVLGAQRASAVSTSTIKAVNNAPIETSLTSLGSIFLPRYSGVRPTIRPPMKTASRTNSNIMYKPVPTPPKTDSR